MPPWEVRVRGVQVQQTILEYKVPNKRLNCRFACHSGKGEEAGDGEREGKGEERERHGEGKGKCR